MASCALKTILITGATDGIGLETAKRLAVMGHHVLLHGRSATKLEASRAAVPGAAGAYLADLSNMSDVLKLAQAVSSDHETLDVLINNAGVLKAPSTITADGLDIRFAVNTLAPYVLARRLLPKMSKGARIVNLSSAAQAPIDASALLGQKQLSDDMQAYSQSKLGITTWSRMLATELGQNGPLVVSVNPGSLLGTNMVRDAFGIPGNDVGIGADIVVRAALSAEFEGRSGQYFDNDSEAFAAPHPAALDERMASETMRILEELAARTL